MQTHIVVTCSKRKKDFGPVARLSELRRSSVEARTAAWMELLSAGEAPAIPAGNLYQGEQWALLREFEKSMPAGHQLWILSAGYGLIPFDAPLRPYSATFSRHHVDSVFDPSLGVDYHDAIEDWWEELSRHPGPAAAARSLTALVEEDPDAAMMVAASPVYLRATRRDLRGAAERMKYPDKMLVLSGGSGARDEYPPLLWFDARLQAHVGGSLMALNVRVLLALLAEAQDMGYAGAQALLDEWTSKTPDWVTHDRTPLDDAAVMRFIREELVSDTTARWSPLLRKLRDQVGGACEQKRFRSLYQRVSEEMLLTR